MSLFTIAEAFVVLLVARQSVPSEVYKLAAVEDAGAYPPCSAGSRCL